MNLFDIYVPHVVIPTLRKFNHLVSSSFLIPFPFFVWIGKPYMTPLFVLA